MIYKTGLPDRIGRKKKNEPFSSQKRREIDGRSEETDQTLVISIYVLHPGHP